MARGPRPELTVALTTGLRLALTPALRQSLALLRMPGDELTETLAQAARDNPWLRMRPPQASAYELALAEAEAPLSHHESLAAQLSLQRLAPEILEAALRLVVELREDGYLDTPLPELAQLWGLPLDLLEQALAALQACDPPGVGARSLAECLSLQLDDLGFAPDLARHLLKALPIAGSLDKAAQSALGLSRAETERLRGVIPRLTPRPLARAGVETRQLRLPELLVTVASDGSLRVQSHPAGTTRLSLAQDYPRGLSPEMEQALAEARGLVSAVARRAETLLSIGQHLIGKQAGFFQSRGAHLLPETQLEAAAALSMAPSTLSRAISGKALEFEGRVWPLSRFFSRALDSRFGPLSAFDIQRRIAAMIATEPPEAPLSDEGIAAQLSGEGVDIARRTVAKYRTCLRIAPSSKRRRRV